VAVTGTAGMGCGRARPPGLLHGARGVRDYVMAPRPGRRHLIDIGGRDAKMSSSAGGRDMRMNATCAGGTGAFIGPDGHAPGTPDPRRPTPLAAEARTPTHRVPVRRFAKTDVQNLISRT